MIRRIAIGQVSDPLFVVDEAGVLQAHGSRIAYVLTIEQAFDDPEAAQAMFRRIQARGSILDEEIEYCSGSGRWPTGTDRSGRMGVCPMCRAPVGLTPEGRARRHEADPPEPDGRVPGEVPPGQRLEVL